MRRYAWNKKQSRPLQLTKNIATAALFLCLAGRHKAEAFQGYNVVITNDPVIEQGFLASTTNQWLGSLVKNPLAPPTLPVYQINLTGTNPVFNPPINNLSLLQSLVTVDSYTYVYGWAAGVSYQQSSEEGTVGNYGSLCAFATNYTLIQASTTTWNVATCQDTVTNIIDMLFQESLSTAPVLGF